VVCVVENARGTSREYPVLHDEASRSRYPNDVDFERRRVTRRVSTDDQWASQ